MARTTKSKAPVDLGPTTIYLPQGATPGTAFHPRSYQSEVLVAFQDGVRRFMLVWHRRSGKDTLALALTQKGMLRKAGTYLHVLPTKVMARSVVWDGTDDQGIPFRNRWPKRLILPNANGPEGLAINDAEMVIEFGAFPGHDPHARSRWVVTGADDPNRLAGQNPMGVVFSEYQLMEPAVWTKIVEPMLAANGGWAAFVFTPEGENHAHDLFRMAEQNRKWFTSHRTVEQTRRDAEGEDGLPIVPLVEDPAHPQRTSVAELRRQGTPEEDIQSQYFCSFQGSIRGAVFGDLILQAEQDKRVAFLPYEVHLPVGTAWDLGRRNTAIWFFQEVGPGIHCINYVEGEGDLQSWAKELDRLPYRYGLHLFPWDLRTPDLITGTSRLDAVRRLLKGRIEVAEKGRVEDGIDATRRFFHKLQFDQTKCERGLLALRSYKYAWDDSKKCYGREPVHDWSSHAADALRTLATTYKAGWMAPERESLKQTHARMAFNLFEHARPKESAARPFNLFAMR